MKRHVYHTKPQKKISKYDDVNIWEEQYTDQKLNNVDDIYQSEVWHILEQYNVLKGLILEAGCGHGRWVKAISLKGYNICAFDFSTIGLKILKNELPEIPILLSDVRKMPYKEESIDTILSWGVLEHLYEGPEDALLQTYHSLKKDGIFAISIPRLSINRLINPLVLIRKLVSRSNFLRQIFNRGGKVFFQYEYTVADFRQRLIKSGFHVFHEQNNLQLPQDHH